MSASGTQVRIDTHPGGWPRIWNYDSFYRRAREAWWILTGYQSLHSAWQNGYDQGHIEEINRTLRGGR